MTVLLNSKKTALLRQAAVRATLAPSVHNTQPWRFVLSPDELDFYADGNRQLHVLDPSRRQLIISCGCALFNARVSLAAAGYDAVVGRFCDPNRPDQVARLSLPTERSDWVPIGKLDAFIERRRSNRREYLQDEVRAEELYDLAQAASDEGVLLFQIREPGQRSIIARLSQQADIAQTSDPEYLAELRAWTSDDPRRRDGVQAMAVPLAGVDGNADVPIRDFDTRGMGWLPASPHSSMEQCLLLLGTHEDNPLAWLRAGEALERVWLEATRHDYVASLFTQVIEIPQTRELLRTELNLQMYPQVLLRVGRAPSTPRSQRRDVDELMDDPMEPATGPGRS